MHRRHLNCGLWRQMKIVIAGLRGEEWRPPSLIEIDGIDQHYSFLHGLIKYSNDLAFRLALYPAIDFVKPNIAEDLRRVVLLQPFDVTTRSYSVFCQHQRISDI